MSDEARRWGGDARGLERALRARISGEVRFDDGSRALYATDASNYRQVPIGVVIPKTAGDVAAAFEVARQFGAPILARGGGTSLAGQCCNVAVVLDFSKYLNRVIEINPKERWARVEPGIVLDDLRAAALQHGLTFGPDPATHAQNTLGGMIGNNSCGMHAQMAGKVEDNVYELDILTYDGLRLTVGETPPDELERLCARDDRTGQIYRGLRELADRYAADIRERFPNIPRRVSGYSLNELLPENHFNVARSLVGTECTCAIVLSAKVKLIVNPDKRCLLVLAFADVCEAGDAVARVNAHGPIALEGFDDLLLEFIKRKRLDVGDDRLLPGIAEAKGWLICEFGRIGDMEGALAAASVCEADLRSAGAIDSKIITGAHDQKVLWEFRDAALPATSKVPGLPDLYPGWEDSAVPPEAVGRYLRDLRALFEKYGYVGSLYGHFGQGCIHVNTTFDLHTEAGVEAWKAFLLEAAQLIRRYGGSLSGEHGDGQARAALLPIMYGERVVEAFRAFKHVWDPQNRMNPGKVVDAYPVDVDLREGPPYNLLDPPTYFSFARNDGGSFAYAANRCVGVGKCRSHESGTMCPSYRVTREERHATRGRARLLFEMLRGSPLTGGWRSEEVKSALDLCLACKGCKHDCPVNVDMATYKAEFLAHYYEGRLRPVWAYAFGLIPWWARLGSRVARLANFVTQAPVLSNLAKGAVRMASQRRIPRFSEPSFKAWHRKNRSNPVTVTGGKRVILWVDTFNNYFHAPTAQHAFEVLEDAGYEVVVPLQNLCCGRPLYDYGMLDRAKLFLRRVIDELRPELERGTPIVGLEPSCVSVFKDELLNLFPQDAGARRLSEAVTLLGEFLAADESWQAPKLAAKATVHAHCHQKAVLSTAGDTAVLKAMGVKAEWLDAGCCGMAGAFGFEAGEHYEVSVKAGELVLLPSVRKTASDDLIISNGFSCREQIRQCTDREALHLADVIYLAAQSRTLPSPL
ncbi:MAG TPA: FAD-binding and (Fe-S)-binding domain-containing protein [Candidatus Cybelea sp.]